MVRIGGRIVQHEAVSRNVRFPWPRCRVSINKILNNPARAVDDNFFADPATASTSFGPILLSNFAQGHTGLGKVLNGFSYWNADMRLGKETAITERVKMDISLDALNVFNNVNFLTPGPDSSNGLLSGMDITNPANFGVVSASRILSGHNSSARYLQLGLRFTF